MNPTSSPGREGRVRLMGTGVFRALLLAVLASLLAACFPRGDSSVPIPHALVPAPQAATRLVVVLPGRADDLAAMQRSGMAEAVQSSWPDADVILTGLSLDYYMQGQAAQRLHNEIVAPARRRGYRQVWLAGASMGGMGTLMYDRQYPGEMDGLILLAPYLGERALLAEIADAGGIATWDPGPEPATLDRDNFQHELWRHVHGWISNPAPASRVWLAYGDRDRLRRAMPLLEPALDQSQVLVREGGHDWPVWAAATADILERADDRAD